MIAGVEMSRIGPRLYQGSVPPEGNLLMSRGFDLLALCAVEHQPSARNFPGVSVMHVPFNDDPDQPPGLDELLRITRAAGVIAERWLDGDRVLITCAAGLNRSGLVMAFVLNQIFGCSGAVAVATIRDRRSPSALCNPQFERIASALASDRDLTSRIGPVKLATVADLVEGAAGLRKAAA